RLTALEIYGQTGALRVPERAIAEAMAQFLSLPYRDRIDPKGVRLGILPTPFCRSNSIVPVAQDGPGLSFLLSNPFNWQVLEAVKQVLGKNETPVFILTEPATIAKLLSPAGAPAAKLASIPELEARLKNEFVPTETTSLDRETVANEDSAPIIQLINNLIETGYT